jgi:nicotinate-nucleotide--dimethylbenzimidazole phosphoribosyltransferase
MTTPQDFNAQERASFYRLIAARRDVRQFRPEPIPVDALRRVLEAAHAAPSVGLMQPWNFLVIQSLEIRRQIKDSFASVNDDEKAKLTGTAREGLYGSLKLEGILEAPLNLAVTCDSRRSGPFILGNAPWPETGAYSVCLAIQNLWLAARAEGLGVGWVSLLEKERVARILQLPPEIELIAYLCIGYPVALSTTPMLEKVGWKKRETLTPLLFADTWGNPYARTSAEMDVNLDRTSATSRERLRSAAQEKIDGKTKPPGSLGKLEALAVRLATITDSLQPRMDRQRLFVFAASHGVTARGVSAYPAEVTRQMVLNFIDGGAAINVLARHAGIELHVIDVGVGGEWPEDALAAPGFFPRNVRAGTRDLSRERAMTPQECDQALEAGREQVRLARRDGIHLVGIGEMGIGNTTSASAIFAALYHLRAVKVTGRGTGVTDENVLLKAGVVQEGLDLHAPHETEPRARYWLEAVGGYEIAAMVGTLLEAARFGIPVVVDGFIATSAAAIAFHLEPKCREVAFFSHRSNERAHGAMLETLGVEPLLDFDLRLGEGTGAALAMPILAASARIMCEMATFASAGVSDRVEDFPS